MPKSSFADFIQEWRELLAATQEHSTDLPGLEPLRTSFQQLVEQIETLNLQRESVRAGRQEMTRSMKALIEKAKEEAKRLRGAALTSFGPKSERLSQFGVAPQRKRGSSKRRAGKPTEAPPPAAPAGNATTTAPAPASPPGPEPTSTTK